MTTSRLVIEDGYAVAPNTPGLGIEWDWDAIGARQKFAPMVIAQSKGECA